MRVVVVGAGLSGLFTASELMSIGIEDVIVVDQGEQPGGVARTVTRDGFALEPAVGTLILPHPHLGPILQRIGADVVKALPAASLRYLGTNDRLVPIEASPAALLTPVLSLRSKLRALAEPLVSARYREDDETLDSFCRRRFGDEAGGLMAWLAASGVFAGDPVKLSVESAFPALRQLEVEAGSVVRGALRRRRQRSGGSVRPAPHIPVGGMSAIARAATDQLGERYRPGFEVGSVTRSGAGWIVEGAESLSADAVVISCHPDQAAPMLKGELGTILSRAMSAPVVVVGLGGAGDPYPLPRGFGMLAGPDSGLVGLGVMFESSYAPHRAPDGSWLVRVIAGGARHPEINAWDDQRLVERIVGEVSRAVGRELTPEFTEVVRHSPGIPQYEVGHRAWLEAIESRLSALPGLYLTGWGYRGVGVSHLAADAVATARRVAGSI